MCKITRISRVYTMCLTRVTRENFTGFPREIHMLLLVGDVLEAKDVLEDSTSAKQAFLWRLERQARRHGGHFEAVPSNHCLCPQARNVFPQARIVPQKKVAGTVPLKCILGPVPPKILLVHSQA